MDSIVAWHGTQSPVASPEDFQIKSLAQAPTGFHVGSKKQAMMRKHPRGTLLKVEINISSAHRIPRLKDLGGDWARRLKRHIYLGTSLVCYLNRWEGISAERAIELSDHSSEYLNRLSDAAFRRLVPEASDSWIVLDSSAIEHISLIPCPSRS